MSSSIFKQAQRLCHRVPAGVGAQGAVTKADILTVLQVVARRYSGWAAMRKATLSLPACVLLFVLALTRYWVHYDSNSLVPKVPESWHLAHNISTTGNFASPFYQLDTGASAHLAPAFPAFLALLTRIFGTGAAGAYAYQFAAALAMCLMVGLFPIASRILGMGVLTGFLAGCLWIVAKLPVFPSWEVSYTALGAVIATCLFRQYLESTTSSLKITIPLGFSIGLLPLLTPTCIPILACWLIWLIHKRGVFLLRGPNLALIILPAMMISPWIARNYLIFHKIIPVRDNLGMELAVSNNDCAEFGVLLSEVKHCFEKVHPNANLEEATKVRTLGEARYNELRLRDGLRWIDENRSRFVALSRQRFIAFWMPHETADLLRDFWQRGVRLQPYSVYSMSWLSLAGLWILARRDIRSAVLLAMWLVLFPLIYYVIQYEDRYRYPIMWTTFLSGALPISLGIEWLWKYSKDSINEREASVREAGRD
jgi:hypothetical protein